MIKLRTIIWMGWIISSMIGVLMSGIPVVFADSVEIDQITPECVVGEKLYVNLRIELDDPNTPIDVSKAQLNGKPLRYQVGETSTSSFTLTINGKVVKQSGGVVKNYTFEIPTHQTGTLILPGFDVTVGGKTYRIQDLTFQVLPRPTSDQIAFTTEIVNAQPYYFPTQVIQIHCTLYYRGSPAIENIHLPFLKERALSLIPPEKTNFEAIVNNETMRIYQTQGHGVYQGKSYNTFEFDFKLRIMEPGDFQFDNFIKMRVETGRKRRRMGFFGPTIERERVSVYADAPPLKLHVRQLPKDNVPPAFNGAIGDFRINVTPDRTDVKVGDPITLSVEISGRGTWEFVKAPPLHKFPEITDYFIISPDPVAGEVSADGTRKTFLIRLRVKSKTAREIPPIPFTYFNLVSQKYVTIHSDPVPLNVFEATEKTEVVDFSRKQDTGVQKESSGSGRVPGPKQPAPVSKPSTDTVPEMPELIQIADNVADAMITENHDPNYFQLIYGVAPLALIWMFVLIRWYRNRDISGEKQKKEKVRHAYKSFLNHISHLEDGSDDAATNFYRDLANGIYQFIRDRFQVTAVDIDESVLDHLEQTHQLDPHTKQELMTLMDALDEYRYSPRSFDPNEGRQLLNKAKKVLKQCDKNS